MSLLRMFWSLSLSLIWQAVAEKLKLLKKKLGEGEFSALSEIRETVLQLAAPPQLVCFYLLKSEIYFSYQIYPADELFVGEHISS